jgi:uncharacterized membrane protein YraQ (UPF0718 family)
MLKRAADYITFDLIGLIPGTHLGEALNFFLYDTAKIFLLLTTIIYVVAIIRSSFPPEKTKRMLSHKREYVGNVLAALLGIVTPSVPAPRYRFSSVLSSRACRWG